MFTKKAPHARIKNRSSRKYENVTDEEAKVMRLTLACPDCGGVLLKGPEGGISQNILCRDCRSEFNGCFIDDIFWGERISEPGEGRSEMYGLPPKKPPKPEKPPKPSPDWHTAPIAGWLEYNAGWAWAATIAASVIAIWCILKILDWDFWPQ